jgi:hypothetical protein
MESFDTGHDPIVYRIDADDNVVSVNTTFRRFAEANGSPGLAEATIGSSLWSAVAGDETSLLWRELVARARTHAVVSVPYRCDAPGLRRQLQMRLSALPAGGVEFISTLTRAEERDPVALLAASYGTGEPVRACSWCRRVDADGYTEIEDAVARLGLLEQELRPISHALCPNCAADVRAAAGLPAA